MSRENGMEEMRIVLHEMVRIEREMDSLADGIEIGYEVEERMDGLQYEQDRYMERAIAVLACMGYDLEEAMMMTETAVLNLLSGRESRWAWTV